LEYKKLFRIIGVLGLILGITVSLTGCDSPAQFVGQLNQQWNAVLILLRGGQSPLAKRPEPKASARTLTPSEAAAKAKQNSELLQEVLRVVYNRELDNRAEFGNLLDTLNQGASIEGLYNGFTHSSDYRKLEVGNPGAKPEALAFFAGELGETEALMSTPTIFNEGAALPLAAPVTPEDTGVSDVSYGATPAPSPSLSASASPSPLITADRKVVQDLERKYNVEFANASIFTLKRVLSDELLKLVSEKSHDPKALQAWYGEWVERMASKGVDFGVPLRNRADAAFHTQWAATADPDRLRWEILNRVHRILNARNAGHP
jgi:hypothetical protein